VCADQHDVSGVLRVRPGTQDAEEQDFDRAGCVGIRAGTSEEDGEGPFEKRAGSSDDNRIGCEEDVLVLQLVLQQHGPASMPGHFAGASTGSIFQKVSRAIGAVQCINGPLLPPESRFCVPLVTITFKTWVFLNFAMERPSRFASLKAAIPRTREWMQADVATRQADEPVRNRPGSGQSRPDPTGPAAAGRAEGDQSCRPFHAGLRRLRLRRYHLPRHGAVEQRGAGMAARQYLQPAGALQYLPEGLQPGVADAELSDAAWSP